MSNSNSADLAIILTQDGEEVQIPEHFIEQFPSIDAYLVCNKDDEKGTGKKFFKIPTNAPTVNKFHLDLILEYLELQRFYDTPASLKGKLPGFFAKYSSEQLKDAANVASFLGVTSLVNAIGEHFVSEIMKMKVSEMPGFFGEDFDEESRDRLIKWEQAVKLAKEKQAKLDEEKQAKLDAEAKARKEEEEKRELEEAKLRDELDEQEQDENDVNDENNEW